MEVAPWFHESCSVVSSELLRGFLEFFCGFTRAFSWLHEISIKSSPRFYESFLRFQEFFISRTIFLVVSWMFVHGLIVQRPLILLKPLIVSFSPAGFNVHVRGLLGPEGLVRPHIRQHFSTPKDVLCRTNENELIDYESLVVIVLSVEMLWIVVRLLKKSKLYHNHDLTINSICRMQHSLRFVHSFDCLLRDYKKRLQTTNDKTTG